MQAIDSTLTKVRVLHGGSVFERRSGKHPALSSQSRIAKQEESTNESHRLGAPAEQHLELSSSLYRHSCAVLHVEVVEA